MKNEILQGYYDYFVENSEVEKWSWYKSLRDTTKTNNEYENMDFKEFLKKYLFKQDNGLGNISQGVIWNTKDNPNQEKIIENFNNNENIKNELFSATTPSEAFKKLKPLFKDTSRGSAAAQYRLLRALFPDKMTAVDAENKLDRLVDSLKNRLDVEVEGDNYIPKHEWLMTAIEDEKNDNYKKQIFFWEIYDMLEDNLDLKKAIVYYGAPGTGKTYKAKKEAKKFIERWRLKNKKNKKDKKEVKKPLIEIVQFHPSFSYEDFIEGIRPSMGGTLELKAGVFKKFCKKAGKIELELYANEFFKGKTFSDIKVSEIDNEEQKKILGIDDNNFKNLTLQDIIEPAFFIIDEINRAELSRVFGELMYSLEYRGYEGKIKTQYSYLNNDKSKDSIFYWEDDEDWFFIPQNVYIIGTMNTIDRSVDSFDFALRRRFSWKEIEPNYDVIKNELSENYGKELSEKFKKLNDDIEKDELLGRDYRIGHSYALSIKNKKFDNLKDAQNFLWAEFIKPLMQEYLRGLGDSTKSNEKLKKFEETFTK